MDTTITAVRKDIFIGEDMITVYTSTGSTWAGAITRRMNTTGGTGIGKGIEDKMPETYQALYYSEFVRFTFSFAEQKGLLYYL
jgi:hypothetical protein